MAPALRQRVQDWLRSLERYTKTDMVYLSSGGFWLVVDQLAGGVAAFLVTVAFAHYLPKDAFGTYRFFIAGFWILTAFTMTGLPTVVSQAVARGREGFFRSSFLVSIRWSVPLALGALGVAAYYLINGNEVLAYGFAVIAVLGPLMQAAFLFGSYLIGKKDFRSVALYGALFASVPAFALITSLAFTQSPVILLCVYLASTVLTGLSISTYLLLKNRLGREMDAASKRLGVHFSAMNLLSTLAAQIDKLIVFHYVGAVELAVYALATAIPEQLKNVFGSAATLALPKFIARPFKEIRSNFWNRLWLFTGSLTIVAVVYIAAAPLVFSLFFPAYAEAVIYTQIYALALIPIGSIFPVTLLQAREAKRELYLFNILSSVFQIGSLILLTSLFGLMGAITARILGRIWSLAVSAILMQAYAGQNHA